MSNRDPNTHQTGPSEISPTSSQRRPSARLSRPTGSRTTPPTSRRSAPKAPRETHSPPPSPPPPPATCWAVTWDGGQRMHEPLLTPDALRAFLDARPPPAAVAAGGVAIAAGEDRSSSNSNNAQSSRKPLLLLHGLAPVFVRVLLNAPLAVDPGFVEAHAARRRYQPSPPPGRLGATAVDVAQWNYPELVGGFARAMLRGNGSALPGGEAAVRAVSDREDLAAVECRVSVWVAETVDVLLLDRPVWGEPGGLLKKVKKRAMAATGLDRRADETEGNTWDAARIEPHEEMPSLEDILQETMSLSTDTTGSSMLMDILERAAYDKWLDFFEALTPRQTPLVADGMSLEWRALQALEGNLEMAKRLAHNRFHEQAHPSPPDWPSLLQRLRDRAALLATIPPSVHKAKAKAKPHRTFHAENFTKLPIPPRQRPRSPPPPPAASPAMGSGGGGGDDQNQRALDRVTYLGGLLLPISIVSSVLSMSGNFEPGQSLFWVFWVASVPLVLLTFVVIYADKLRGAEVWVEVGSLDGGSSSGDEAVEKGRGKKKKEEQKKTHGGEGLPEHEKWAGLAVDDRAGKHRREDVRPQAMAYAGDDVVIDLSDAVAQSQPPPLQPRTSHESEEGVQPPRRQYRRASSSYSPHQPSIDSNDDVGDDSNDDDNDDDDHDDEEVDPNMYITRPTDGSRRHAWRKKQLGWAGAAMCMLRMQAPLRVEDGLPRAPGPRRDVERRLRQARRRASVEGRRSLSF